MVASIADINGANNLDAGKKRSTVLFDIVTRSNKSVNNFLNMGGHPILFIGLFLPFVVGKHIHLPYVFTQLIPSSVSQLHFIV